MQRRVIGRLVEEEASTDLRSTSWRGERRTGWRNNGCNNNAGRVSSKRVAYLYMAVKENTEEDPGSSRDKTQTGGSQLRTSR